MKTQFIGVICIDKLVYTCFFNACTKCHYLHDTLQNCVIWTRT